MSAAHPALRPVAALAMIPGVEAILLSHDTRAEHQQREVHRIHPEVQETTSAERRI